MFTTVLARLVAQILLGIALFLWTVIAWLDVEHPANRPWFAAGAVLAAAALFGLRSGQPWTSWTGAIALIGPIGVMAHGNGASPWLWIVWIIAIVGTERWIRTGNAAGARQPKQP